jgi:hypothetical protein
MLAPEPQPLFDTCSVAHLESSGGAVVSAWTFGWIFGYFDDLFLTRRARVFLRKRTDHPSGRRRLRRQTQERCSRM